MSGRSPYGERGLKSRPDGVYTIEDCRSPYGERGLKYEVLCSEFVGFGRSPYGERGLKYPIIITTTEEKKVALLTESVD